MKNKKFHVQRFLLLKIKQSKRKSDKKWSKNMVLNVQCDGIQHKNQLKNFDSGRLDMVAGRGCGGGGRGRA